MEKVLIIDDNRSSEIDDNRSSDELEIFLRDRGYSAISVDTVDEGLKNINASENLKVILLNAELSAKRGWDALKRIKREHPEIIVIVIRAGVQTARRAMSLGALEVLSHNDEKFYRALDQVFERLSIRSNTLSTPENQDPLVGRSEAMFELNKQIGLAAKSNVPVLIEGETGTGKGLVARLIHEESERAAGLIHEESEHAAGENKRARRPFIPFDCGAVPDTLRETELFGHEEGAFTDAKSERSGAFERADGGTLFLDEVGNMTPALQGTFLNVLQEKEFQRVGGTQARSVEVRIICATNQKLKEMVEGGKFREDLFHRLDGYKISIPPLRERLDDIPRLVAYFLACIKEKNGKPIRGVSDEVMELLKKYDWPGNVRELETCLQKAAVTAQGEGILPGDLPRAIQMCRRDERTERNTPEMRSSEMPRTPIYRNLLDLPVVAFCRLISDTKSDVTASQIAEWWEGFSNDGRTRANRAKGEIDNWWNEFDTTTQLTFPKLSKRIKETIDDAISQLSYLRHRHDTEIIAEVAPVSIIGKTHKGSLTAVLHETVKGHGGNKEKAARELRISLDKLERWLSYRTEAEGNDTNNSLRTSIQPSRRLERFPTKEIERLLKEPINSLILENFSRTEWRNKSLNDQMLTIHLALKVLSQRLPEDDEHRLDGDHGCIYFGGMTFSRIEWNIYSRARYLYADHAEVAKALKVDIRTIKKYWPENKSFPSRHTLFTDGMVLYRPSF